MNVIRKTKTVIVAMSGGVDSSVAAAVLQQQGYDVVGITLKLWDDAALNGQSSGESSCCSYDTIERAGMVCHQLGIPHYTVNSQQAFRECVLDNFVQEYLEGRTPNPCIRCNADVKWKALYRKADALNAAYIATGHYALVDRLNSRYCVRRAQDQRKDQSYVLWKLSQRQLARTIFPLGTFTKAQVRALAESLHLQSAYASESQDFCFIGDENHYGTFLREHVTGLEREVRGGPIMTAEGAIVGRHKGYPFYTIGQRKGLGIALGNPVYVYDIDPETNTVYVGEEHHVLGEECLVGSVNWCAIKSLDNELEADVKIRYNSPGAAAVIRPAEGGCAIVQFRISQRAITPGQSAVFYQGDIVVGGGIIKKVLKKEGALQQD